MYFWYQIKTYWDIYLPMPFHIKRYICIQRKIKKLTLSLIKVGNLTQEWLNVTSAHTNSDALSSHTFAQMSCKINTIHDCVNHNVRRFHVIAPTHKSIFIYFIHFLWNYYKMLQVHCFCLSIYYFNAINNF